MAARKKSNKKAFRRAVPESVPMRDARAKLTVLVDLAEWRGERTVLTRNGKAVAMLIPMPGSKPRAEQAR